MACVRDGTVRESSQPSLCRWRARGIEKLRICSRSLAAWCPDTAPEHSGFGVAVPLPPHAASVPSLLLAIALFKEDHPLFFCLLNPCWLFKFYEIGDGRALPVGFRCLTAGILCHICSFHLTTFASDGKIYSFLKWLFTKFEGWRWWVEKQAG